MDTGRGVLALEGKVAVLLSVAMMLSGHHHRSPNKECSRFLPTRTL
jgi:hypothetical protein